MCEHATLYSSTLLYCRVYDRYFSHERIACEHFKVRRR